MVDESKLTQAINNAVTQHRKEFSRDVSYQELHAILTEILTDKRREFLKGILADHPCQDIVALRRMVQERIDANVLPGQLELKSNHTGATVYKDKDTMHSTRSKAKARKKRGKTSRSK